jgi:transcriptional pleiotropic repressor
MVLKRIKSFLDLLQTQGNDLTYADLISALKEASDNSIYLVDKNGRILAHSVDSEFSDSGYDEEWLVNERVPDELNNSLLRIGAVTEFEGFEAANILVAPVVGGSRRVGSLLFAGTDAKFDDDDMVIAEFAATAIGMIIANRIDLQQEDEAQEVKLARSAINSLSYSEILFAAV